MTNLLAAIMERENEMRATETGKAFLAAGFDIEQTGGGCMAWLKSSPAGFVWVTDGEGTGLILDAGNPSDHWLVGLYRAGDDELNMIADHDGGTDLAGTIEAATAMLIAYQFSENLAVELGAFKLMAAVRDNHGKYADEPSVCATHDYCDANMPMSDAFTAVTGREIDPASDDDANLWNRAWDIAKAADFYTAKA